MDVQLLELEARDRRRPARAGSPSGQLQELAGAAAAAPGAYLVDVQLAQDRAYQLLNPQLKAWKKPISSPPQAAQGGD